MPASDFYSGLPQSSGMDFGLNRPGIFGRGINLTPFFPGIKEAPSYSDQFKKTDSATDSQGTSSQDSGFPAGSAVGDFYEQLKALGKYKAETLPQDIEAARLLGQVTTEQQLKQLQQLYPFLSAAGAETTARNLAASQTYRRFAEGLPSNVQNIMASKQSQMQSAQQGEAALQYATADQLRAAKESQGRFAGQYVQFV